MKTILVKRDIFSSNFRKFIIKLGNNHLIFFTTYHYFWYQQTHIKKTTLIVLHLIRGRWINITLQCTKMLNIKRYAIFYFILIIRLSDITFMTSANQAQKIGKNRNSNFFFTGVTSDSLYHLYENALLVKYKYYNTVCISC